MGERGVGQRRQPRVRCLQGSGRRQAAPQGGAAPPLGTLFQAGLPVLSSGGREGGKTAHYIASHRIPHRVLPCGADEEVGAQLPTGVHPGAGGLHRDSHPRRSKAE